MIAIRNPHALMRLSRDMIQRVPRGVTPSRTITAPEPESARYTTSEDDRLAQFALSAATRNGRVPNPPVRRDRALVPLHATPARAADPSPLGQGAAGVASHEDAP